MANKIAMIARRFPGIANVLRRVLPLSLKRRIGAMMLERNPTGLTRAADGRLFQTIPDRVFLQVIYDGEFEPSLSNVIRNTLQSGDTAVDIGANFGWFATLMAQTAKRVITYEPAFRMDGILRENVALNDMTAIIDMRKKAVGAEPGTATFVIEGDPERESALGYVTVGDVSAADDMNTENVEIVCIGDDLAEFAGNIALIKLDAEGFEHYAIQGGGELFSNDNPPVLITEANAGTLGRSGSTREALCAEIAQYGYTLYGMTSEGVLYPDDGKAPALTCLPNRGRFVGRITA